MVEEQLAGQIEMARENRLEIWKKDYQAALFHRQQLATFILEEIKALPGLTGTLHQFLGADSEADRRHWRKQLEEICKPYYWRLQKNEIRQLHFHSPESDSILRMHKMDRYGDSLVGVRATVVAANETLEPVTAFEEGRIFNGFRYVFPLFHNGHHIGSVETSFSAQALIDYLKEVHRQRCYQFVIRKSTVTAKVFDDLQDHYQPFSYADQFLIERRGAAQSHPGRICFQDLGLDESRLREILSPLTESELPATSLLGESTDPHLLLYYPVRNFSGKHIAGFLAVEPLPQVRTFASAAATQKLILILAGNILVLLAASALYFRQSVRKEKTRVQQRLAKLASHFSGLLYQFRLDPATGQMAMPFATEGIHLIFGVGPESVAEDATPVIDRIHPDDREDVKASIRESARQLEPWYREFRVLLNETRTEWVQGSASPEKLHDGSVLWHGIILNITDRKESQLQLVALQERLQVATRAGHIGVWEYDPHNDHLIWDQRMHEIFGITEYTFDGTFGSWRRNVHPDDIAATEADFREALAGGAEFHTEFRLLLGSGEVRHVTGDAQILRNEAGRVLRVYGVNQDVTEQRRTEERIRENGREQTLLLETIPVQVWYMTDPETYGSVNQAHADFMGLSVSEVVGRKLSDLLPPEAAELCRQAGEAAFRDGKPTSQEEVAYDGQGRRRILEVTKTPFRNSKGKIESLICSAVDITGRKEAETLMQEQNRQLQEAKEQAMAANQAKSAFLAAMSHEIRTPMNAIIGMASLLLKTPLDRQQNDFAETIVSSGDTLLALINDILDFSKIEAGRLDLESEPFDLYDAVLNPLEMVAPKAAEKSLELTYSIAPNAPGTFVGDSTRLRQVILNLLSNAVKFTEAGEVHIKVEAEQEPTGNWSLTFHVRDTGIGMEADTVDNLFTAFTQADASTTRRFGGTGLGLAISKRIIDHMGGRFTVESEPGKGSTFSFSIKLPAGQRTGKIEHLSANTPLKGQRFLLVDDNRNNLKILETLLEAWDCASDSFTDPQAALSGWALSPAPYDAVLLDLHMPGMDGFELARKLEQSGCHAPRILISSSTPDMDRESVESLFAETLLKPVRPNQLHEVISLTIGKSRRKQGSVTPPESSPSAGSGAARKENSSMPPLDILLAEDNPTNRTVIIALLESYGHSVTVARNGREAVDAVLSHRYDLILMDIQMPVLDGFGATREIREQIPAEDDRPVIIALTANALRGDREACLAAGMDDYLPKPVKPSALDQCLRDNFLKTKPESAAIQAVSEMVADRPLLDPRFIEPVVRSLPPDKARTMLSTVLDQFTQSIDPAVATMETARSGKDEAALAAEIHKLKGGAGAIGLARLSAMAEHYLEGIRSEHQPLPAEAIPQMRALTDESVEAFKSWMDAHYPG
jgi:PAS domain S-box-containing protein